MPFFNLNGNTDSGSGGGGITASDTAPADPAKGDQWLDTGPLGGKNVFSDDAEGHADGDPLDTNWYDVKTGASGGSATYMSDGTIELDTVTDATNDFAGFEFWNGDGATKLTKDTVSLVTSTKIMHADDLSFPAIRTDGIRTGTNGGRPTNGYEVAVRGTSVALSKQTSGNYSSLGSSYSHGLSVGQWLNVRFEAVGTDIRVRAWQAGTEEPDVWHIEASDSDHTSGYVQYTRRGYPGAPTVGYVDNVVVEDPTATSRGILKVWDGSTWVTEGPALTTGDLTDLDTSGVSDGQTLTYDSASGLWIAQTPDAGASTLAELTDVDPSGVSDGQTVVFDSASSTWLPAAVEDGRLTIADVPPSSPPTGHLWVDTSNSDPVSTYAEDDFTGADSDPLDAMWTTVTLNGGTDPFILSNQAALQIDPATTGSFCGMTTNGPAGELDGLTSFELSGQFTVEHNDQEIRIAINGDGTWTGDIPTEGYELVLSPNNTNRQEIFRIDAGSRTSLETNSMPMAEFTTYLFRWTFDDVNGHQIKIWEDYNSEPGSWLMVPLDTTYNTGGHVSVSRTQKTTSETQFMYFDNFMVAPFGASDPFAGMYLYNSEEWLQI